MEDLVVNLGMYEEVLIDTQDIQVYIDEYDEKPLKVKVSADVEALHSFVKSEKVIELPCYSCQKKQPHKTKKAYYPISDRVNDSKQVNLKRLSNINNFDNCSYLFGVDIINEK